MSQDDERKASLYRWIKIGGLLSFLPFVLGAGPIAGFYLGNYLERRFCLPVYVTIILVTIGFIASLKESIRIIRMALKTQEKS